MYLVFHAQATTCAFILGFLFFIFIYLFFKHMWSLMYGGTKYYSIWKESSTIFESLNTIRLVNIFFMFGTRLKANLLMADYAQGSSIQT